MTADETVLVVEDEPALLDLYDAWLRREYDVRTADTGEEGLRKVDETVGAALLDRRMAGMNGDETLVALRDRGVDCPVAMVSAVEPGIDVVDLPLDEYVVKPTRMDEIVGVVEGLLELRACDPPLREFVRTASKRAIVEANVSHSRLEADPAYEDLCRRFEALESQVERSAVEETFGNRPDSTPVGRVLR